QVIRNGIVTHTNDTTDTNDVRWPGSLREVITDLDTNASGGHLEFNIPGTGPFKIAPAIPLPTVLQNIVIDGYSQPGSHPNTRGNGTDAVILIELSGENQGGNGNGLNLGQSGITVRGLCLNRFTNNFGINSSTCCGSGGFC